MKSKTIFLLLSAVFLTFFGSCDIDNYDEPDATVSGGIYDAKTGNLIPMSSPNGARIRLYEDGAEQPQNFWVKYDGTFENTRVFAGKFTITVEGPFVSTSIPREEINVPSSDIKLTVEPLLRVTATPTLNGSTVTVRFTVTRSDQSKGNVRNLFLLYGNTVGLSTTANIQRVNVLNGYTLGQEATGTIENVDTSKPIYIRVGARSTESDYYNYSELVRLN